MRLLSGTHSGAAPSNGDASTIAEWTRVTAGDWLALLLNYLKYPDTSQQIDPGKDLNGALRPYQRDGLAWLYLLYRLRLGACLADDMGLGKTIQILALLLVLKKNGALGPHLLVVPASLLGNWRAEAARFAP